MQDDWSDFAWLVGIIEGEGYVTPRKFRQYHYARIGVEMTCEDVICKLAKVANCGWVTGPRFREGKKPQWKWQVSGDPALELLLRIKPYMSIKKSREIDDFFMLVEQENLLRINGGRRFSKETNRKISLGVKEAWNRRKQDGV